MTGVGRRLRTFSRAGLTFDVRDHGPLDGPTVVCLHGFPQDGTAFDAVAPLLTAGGMRVLVPDQRGYSPGARPPGRAAYALSETADDVLALLDSAGVGRAHVVGHDWGGVVGWALAGRHSAQVQSLTALSTPHPAAVIHSLPRSDQSLRSSYAAAFQLPGLPERALLADDGARLRRALLASGLPRDRADHYVRRMQEPGALTAALGWYRAIPTARGFSAGSARVPTAFVYGRRDPFFSRVAVRSTGRYVQGPLRMVALDAGHWLPELQPRAIADVVASHVGRAPRPPG